MTTHPSNDRGFSWLATTASFRSVSNERRLNFCRVLDTPFRSSIVSVNQTLAPLDAGGAHPGVRDANSAAALLPFLMLKNDIGYGALRRRTGRRADTASKASRNLLLVILLTRRPERRSISLFVVLLKILNVRSSMSSPLGSPRAQRSFPISSSSSRRKLSGPGSGEARVLW